MGDIENKSANTMRAVNADKRAEDGAYAGKTGIAANIVLFCIKLVLGIFTGSLSVIADAVNNIADAASSVVTLFGFKLSRRPADEDHPYGHARSEYISGFIVSAIIIAAGAELAKTSIEKIASPAPVSFSSVTVIILSASVFVKLWLYFYYRKKASGLDSPVLYAAATDSRNDVITTLAVIAGAVLYMLFRINADGIIGLGIAAFIIYSGILSAKNTINPLMGKGVSKELSRAMTELILSHNKVLGMHDLMVHDYGVGECFATAHVEFSSKEDPLVCHDIIDDMERDAMKIFGVHLVLHYDPVTLDDSELDMLKKAAEAAVLSIDDNIDIHDFRIVKGANNTKVVFDAALPYQRDYRKTDVKRAVDTAFSRFGEKYNTVITFDDKA